MRRSALNLYVVLWVTMAAMAQPTISSLSNTTAARSSRLLVQGSGFGAPGSGTVQIAGIAAPVTRWSDTLIAAYIPETAPTGSDNVQVVTSAGSSNAVPINVTLRSGPSGHIRWRFQADGDYIPSRPAVASDGTVYTQDVYGHLYALTSDGGLKWIFNAPGTGHDAISVGSDGTIYIGTTRSIFALAPNGTVRWRFDQNPAAFILLGPNVGPDGNIYAVGTQGMGVFSLTPQGVLRWSLTENYSRPIVTMQEIVFGPLLQSRLYFHANDHLRAVALDGSQIFTFVDHLDTSQGIQQPVVGPDGSVYSNLFTYPGPGVVLGKFDNNGNELWHIFDQFPAGTSAVTAPDVGNDGVVYDGWNLNTLFAINPDGSVRWKYTDTEMLFNPAVSPVNNVVFLGGATNGQPGFFAAVSTQGSLLWKVRLPIENGLNVDPDPFPRARFTPDGQTAYMGTSIAGQISNGYSYLYSVQLGASGVSLARLTLNPTTVKSGTPSQGSVTLTGPAPAGGIVVTVTSNRKAAMVPPSITIPAGSSSAVFTVNTKVVPLKKIATISATYQGVTKSANLTLLP
ncbi:MAG TPA: PQQ-binding-like beta-propeller repeat protein [Terriglobales bacterium]|nr:PQQ-binding-like beta-propeller repeat protein [Terriglobales bacterium]